MTDDSLKALRCLDDGLERSVGYSFFELDTTWRSVARSCSPYWEDVAGVSMGLCVGWNCGVRSLVLADLVYMEMAVWSGHAATIGVRLLNVNILRTGGSTV